MTIKPVSNRAMSGEEDEEEWVDTYSEGAFRSNSSTQHNPYSENSVDFGRGSDSWESKLEDKHVEGENGKRGLEFTHDTVLPSATKRRGDEAGLARALEQEHHDVKDQLDSLLRRLVLAVERNQVEAVGMVGEIIELTKRLAMTPPPSANTWPALVELATARCAADDLIKLIVSFFRGGAAPDFLRALCREIRRSQRYDVFLEVVDQVMPAILDEPVEVASLDEIRQRAHIDDLPLELEIGMASGKFASLLILKYGLDADEALLDRIRALVTLVMPLLATTNQSTVREREFPWFDGMYSLVEKRHGQSDFRWNLFIKSMERTLARPVTVTHRGRQWEGNLESSMDLGSTSLRGRMKLTTHNSTQQMDIELFEGWMTGLVPNGEVEGAGILGKMFEDARKQSSSLRDVVLSEGTFFDTCVEHDFGHSFAVSFFIRSTGPIAKGDPMTICSNGIVTIQILSDMSSLAIVDLNESTEQILVKLPRTKSPPGWTHIAVSSSPSMIQVRMDFKLVLETKAQPKTPPKRPHSLLVGARVDSTSGDFMQGSICDFKVFAEAMTSLEQLASGTPVMHFPLVDQGYGLSFLENAVDASRPLVFRPGLDKLKRQNQVETPPGIKPVTVRQLVDDQPVMTLKTTTSSITWLDRPVRLRRGFTCDFSIRKQPNVPLDSLQVRMQAMCTMERRDFPRMSSTLTQMDNIPCVLVSLFRREDKYILTATSRMANGVVLPSVRVFQVTPLSLVSSSNTIIDVRIESKDGSSMELWLNSELVCEVPITIDSSLNDIPFFAGVSFSPVGHAELKTFTLDVEPDSQVHETEVVQQPRAVVTLCDQCGAATSSSSATTCDQCANVSGVWTCSQCTYLNTVIGESCEICGAPRPPEKKRSSVQPVSRACAVCTLINDPSATVCAGCDSLLPAVVNETKPASAWSSSGAERPQSHSAWSSGPPKSLAPAQPPSARFTSSRSSPMQDRWMRLRDLVLKSSRSASTNASQSIVFDSTLGAFALTISNEERVLFKCKGELEHSPITCEVTFVEARNEWRILGSRVNDEFRFELVLDLAGEKVLPGSGYRSHLHTGTWSSGEFTALARSMRGTSGEYFSGSGRMLDSPCFKVGLQNMVPGLTNFCSVNAVLQAMYACEPLRDMVMMSSSSQDDEVVRALQSLFVEIETTPNKVISARELQATLPARYRQAQEMDATEVIGDLLSHLEQGLGVAPVRSLLSFPFTTGLRCSKCAAEKPSTTVENTMTILPLVKLLTPIQNIYLGLRSFEYELLPQTLLVGNHADVYIERLPLPLIEQVDANGNVRRVDLYVERLREGVRSTLLPITHIEVGRDPRGDGEHVPVFAVSGERINIAFADLPLVPMFVYRERQASPITDVQIVTGTEARLFQGYKRTKEVQRNGSSVQLAFVANMPITDVFIGTRAEMEAKRYNGYTRLEPALSENPDTGMEVFAFISTADIGGRPPVTRLMVLPHQAKAGEEEGEEEKLSGIIPLGYNTRLSVYQSTYGVGSPITSLQVINAMNRPSIPTESFHSVLDLNLQRTEDMFLITSTSAPSARDIFPSTGHRFLFSKSPTNVNVFEVTGSAVSPHGTSMTYTGIVVEDKQEVTLMGEFVAGGGDFVYASWDGSAWSSLKGSSLLLPSAYKPIVYDLLMMPHDRTLRQEEESRYRFIKRFSNGASLLARMQPNHPQDQPLRSIWIKVEIEQTEDVDEPRFVYHDDQVHFKVFASSVQAEQEDQVIIRVELVETNIYKANHTIYQALTPVGEMGNFTLLAEYGASFDAFHWTGSFYSSFSTKSSSRQREGDLTVMVRRPEPIVGSRVFLDFFRKPLSMKIEGVIVPSSEASSHLWAMGTNHVSPRVVLVKGAIEDDGAFTLQTGSVVVQGRRDNVLMLGVQKDSNEYWEDGKLVFSSRKNGNHLHSMLALAANSEVRDQEGSLVKCESPQCGGTNQPHLSTHTFGVPPPLLILQIDRIKFDMEAQRAVKDFRITPLEVTLNVGSATYALFGIVPHVGMSAQSGHYVTYAREVRVSKQNDLLQENAASASWVLFDDSTTRKVAFQEVVNAVERGSRMESPYLLFYWRLGENDIGVRSVNVMKRLAMERARREEAFAAKFTATRPFLDARRAYLVGEEDLEL